MTLKDICELIVDCPHVTDNDEGFGYPLIRTPNVGKGMLLLENVHRVSKDVYDRRNRRAKPQPGDLILAREAPAGNVALIRESQEVCLGQRTVLIRPNKNLVVPEFLSYYLLAPYNQHRIKQSANGSTVEHVNMPNIRGLEIELPTLHVQKEIASILSNYDTLIEINTKRIKILEESARELYKEWFVRMRFPGYENTKFEKGIPENWKIGYLKDIATLLSQKVKSEEVQIYVTTDNMLKDFKGVDYKELINKPEGKVCYFEKGDILMSNIRPYFKKLWYANQQGGCSADVLIFRANKDIDTHFLYYTMCTDFFIDYVVAGSNGTKMPRGNKVFTMNFPVLVPSKELMDLFRENVSAIYSVIETLQLQNQKLASTRDRLLPRLLSGELKVKA